MKLKAGYQLGPYEILDAIGAGGMGEVYRAKDTRLGREVAIKVLPPEYSTDVDRLRRFEQEAQSASLLNHPNILSVFDIGTHEGCPYVVSELLLGETLRERMGGVALSTRKLVDYALQIAHGLAAAHEKGIVHRDLKPENIFITRDGRAKILDFGLAKLILPEPVGKGKSQIATVDPGTHPGVVLGTVGYMSPEQVRGREVDHRSDLFSFGSLLYEMATGKRAFQRDSTADTLSAILKEDPTDASITNKTLPPAFDRIIRHCLEKNLEERFQSARDLAFDLEMISGLSGTAFSGAAAATSEPRKTKVSFLLLPILFAAGILLGAAGMYWKFHASGTTAAAPTYQRLTFSRGYISSARFSPDSQSVLYSAAWSGGKSDVYVTRPQTPVSRSLNIPGAELVAVSSKGEMAILMNPIYSGWQKDGTLARVPIDGGGARDVLDDVEDADWSPDGTQLAVIRNTPTKKRVEYPIGKIIYESEGWLSDIRLSPDGKWIALMEHGLIGGDDRGTVIVLDLAGQRKVLTQDWNSESGLAWSPKGDEIWFTASEGSGNLSPIHAVTLGGKHRIVASIAGNLVIKDISSTGEALLMPDNRRREMIGLAPGEQEERDLTWMDWSFPRDISNDGKYVLFEEEGAGGGDNYTVYLRGTDGSSAVRLGEGVAIALSPDGKTAVAVLPSATNEITFVPTGSGQPKKVKVDLDAKSITAAWLPDGKTLLFRGRKTTDSPPRAWLYDFETGVMKPLTPEGVFQVVPSIDGSFVVGKCINEGRCIYKIPGGEAVKISGLKPEEIVMGPTSDPNWFFTSPSVFALPRPIERVNIFTGERKPYREINPKDRAGILLPMTVKVAPDGSAYVYTYKRVLADLYIARGLK